MSDTTVKQELQSMTSQERLQAYNLIIAGCSHIWSKNKLQDAKAQAVLDTLVPLIGKDPYFLAHLTSYAIKKSTAKDLRVFLTYVASLSSADGLWFGNDPNYAKPNLRSVGWAALQELEPKLAARVAFLASHPYSVTNVFNEGRHFPKGLRNAIKVYIKNVESNPSRLMGIRQAGLRGVMMRLYTWMHMHPSDEALQILGWKQKDGKISITKKESIFKDLSDLEIAEKIRAEKLPYLGILGELARVSKKVSPVIAVAMLEQATGNQAVIMRSTFEDAGILNDPEVMKLYEEKIADAKSTLDRAETISKTASDAVKQALTNARSTVRKNQMGDIGKVFVHLDFSGSMSAIKQYAEEKGAIIAEMVNDPINNFRWAAFDGRPISIPMPKAFTKPAFQQALFGVVGGGSTDCFANYGRARQFGADVDVFVSDQVHTDGNLTSKIQKYHTDNPTIAKPKVCVIIDFSSGQASYFGRIIHAIKDAYEANGVPVAEIHPDTLNQSALVVEAVRTAMLGPVAIVDDIMDTDLLELPKYYYAVMKDVMKEQYD